MYYQLLGKGMLKDEDKEPDIGGFQFYFDAFQELSTSRQVGMGLGPIPFTAIAEYFRIYELADFDEFAYLIRRMDNVFLELESAEDAARSKQQEGKPSASAVSNKKNPRQGRRTGR
jgi:hypothetical protein